MPELSEVEITRLKLLPLIHGRTILDFWTDWPRGLKSGVRGKGLADSMIGRKILDVARHGKVLFFKLSGTPKRQIAVHLRMSGRLVMADQNGEHDKNDKSVRSSLNKRINFTKRSDTSFSSTSSVTWAHFIWKLTGGKELRFVDPRKFGVVWYGSPKNFMRDPYLGRLGPDAKNISRETFHRVLHNARGAIKPFMLKQDRIAGIGNIIADEVLWLAKIHPQSMVADLSYKERGAILSALRSTLAAMLSAGGTTLRDWGHPDGAKGSFQDVRRIYGKAGLPCPRCKAAFARSIVAGRGTTTCPVCQKL